NRAPRRGGAGSFGPNSRSRSDASAAVRPSRVARASFVLSAVATFPALMASPSLFSEQKEILHEVMRLERDVLRLRSRKPVMYVTAPKSAAAPRCAHRRHPLMKAATAKTRTRFENILFATDFSPAATHAIPFVKALARHFQSKLAVLHVKSPVVNPMTQPATWPAVVEAAKAADERHREELRETFAGINTELLLEEGEIQSNLEKALEKYDTDLVIIGTRGRTGLSKMLLGSVAEEIFRTVPCPVVTVGPHSDSFRANIRDILFATDFASEAPAAAAYAISLAQEFQARLTMLHVVPEGKPGELVSWSDVRDSSKQLLRKLVPDEAELWCKP